MNHLPITGRIGRFVKILQTEITEDDRKYILENAALYESMNSAMKSAWWKSAVEKMDSSLSIEKAVQIMTKCGAKCCGHGQRATARRLYNECDSIQSFLDRISKHDVKDGDLTYTLVNDTTIIAEHHICFCKQVAHTKEVFTTMTYCQCSVEFNKQFFSAAFGTPVCVELLQSIICGAESCKFKVTF
jgi:hypothetical protein